MASTPVLLCVNPMAGRGRTRRRLPHIENLLRAAAIDYRLVKTRCAGDLERQVHKALQKRPHDILVAGGDGSVHEAVNGILRARCRARLGVIPTGTGNDFAKASGISLDWRRSTDKLAGKIRQGGTGRSVDAGRVNSRYFANGVGVGFDAKVTSVARSYRWPIGGLVYLFAIFRSMADGIATPDMLISAGDRQWDGPVTLANVSNGPWIGGMFHVAPMARNDDGQLELVVVAPVRRLRILRLIPKLVRGRHMDATEVEHASVQRLTIAASRPVLSHLDGEVQPLQSRFEIEVLPSALTLL